MVVGIAIQSSYHHFSSFVGKFPCPVIHPFHSSPISPTDDSVQVTPVLLIVVGAIVFVIAFFGCCGAIKKSPCMIGTFFFLLIVVFAMEVGIGVAAYMKYGQLNEILEKGFQSTLDSYETSLDSRHAWDLIQGEVIIDF